MPAAWLEMKYTSVLFEKRERIVRVTLNRPESSNAIDCSMAVELLDACQQISDDDDLRAVVISGAGAAFSTGTDLPQAPTLSESRCGGSSTAELQRQVASAVDAVGCLELPVIAAMNGPALGEGLELALACDVRIASENAQFALPQIRRGLIPMCGGTQRLPRIIGRGTATEMILTGEVIGAAEAYCVGLVNLVVPGDRVQATAEDLAARIARNAPIAARYAKEAILKGLDKPLDQGLRLETDLSVLLQTTEDRAEGLSSFLKRKAPEYKGR